jgi:hypothetical protein
MGEFDARDCGDLHVLKKDIYRESIYVWVRIEEPYPQDVRLAAFIE